jgi:protein ImuB
MFAALYSVTAPVDTLVRVAQSFSPRVEVTGRLVVCDLQGVARLFGGPRDIADHLRRALVDGGAVRLALAPTRTAATLLALGRPGTSVAATSDEARAALAALPVTTLGQWDGADHDPAAGGGTSRPAPLASSGPPTAASPAARTETPSGWVHPRDTHQGPQTRRRLRGLVQMGRGGRRAADAERARVHQALDVLRRWGIRTLGQLAALPADELATRLGALAPRWQHAARGDDLTPLVPMAHDEPFEASLALEWPVEGLEPLSFVLGRVLEPLAVRLERADRGAAVLTTDLHLTTREVHTRTLQLPAPMRDPKTLRTLILLDLESHPPSAAIDRVAVRVEPTPGRIVQWSLIERAQPSPEQVSTLLARLGALMGESHVGSPALVDSWRPGAFAMRAFSAHGNAQRLAAGGWRLDPTTTDDSDSVTAGTTSRQPLAASPCSSSSVAFRRFRLPVPARVTVKDGRPVRLVPDRRGVSGGAIVDSAGPWRTSGHWWDQPPTEAATSTSQATAWDRDEWDVLLADGVACRVYLERDVGQWFVEGMFD